MKKVLYLSLALLIIFAGIFGFYQYNKNEREIQISEGASEVAVEFVKEKTGKDFAVEKTSFNPGFAVSEIQVNGHLKEEKNTMASVSIFYREVDDNTYEYTVGGWSNLYERGKYEEEE